MPNASQQIIFYADLNCPFCFVLNEWIEALDKDRVIFWQGVEHEPEITGQNQISDKSIDRLKCELVELTSRKVDIEVNLPPFRPNSQLALALLERVRKNSAKNFHPLKQRIYRALWWDGRDISDATILKELISEYPELKDLSFDEFQVEKEVVELGTKEWIGTDKDRIPLGLGPRGRFYMGMGERLDFQDFLVSGFKEVDDDASC